MSYAEYASHLPASVHEQPPVFEALQSAAPACIVDCLYHKPLW
jgi:hypothetical protein